MAWRMNRLPGRVLLAVIALAIALIVAQLRLISPSAPSSVRSGSVPAASASIQAGVSYVYDGDTIEATGVGKVRLIGIDAMDDYNMERALSQSRRFGMSIEQVRVWAARATEFARERLKGRRVTLRYGPERTDGYGRTLAYVQVPGAAGEEEDFNLQMLRTGMAVAYHAFPHPRLEAYLKAEKAAQAERTGLWNDATIQP